MRAFARFASFTGVVLCLIAIGAPAASAGSGTIEMSIDEAGPLQSGRIFRDATPSSCPSKAYPGLFDSGTPYAYQTFSFVAPVSACMTIARTSASCETNAHLSLYESSYSAVNQEANYLGDQGSSVNGEPFGASVTAGETYVVVATNTTAVESCAITAEIFLPGYAAPKTVIDSGPSGTIATNEATFSFHGDPTGDTAKVQCRIDGGAFADCVSPKAFTGLADGAHSVEFRAENSIGFQDASPAIRTFLVDTTPHVAPVVAAPDTCTPARQALAAAQQRLKQAKRRVAKAARALKKAKAPKKASRQLKKARAAKKAAVRGVKKTKAAVAGACG